MPYYWERDKHLVYNRVPKFCSTSWSGVELELELELELEVKLKVQWRWSGVQVKTSGGGIMDELMMELE
jgi:hypothetical protein